MLYMRAVPCVLRYKCMQGSSWIQRRTLHRQTHAVALRAGQRQLAWDVHMALCVDVALHTRRQVRTLVMSCTPYLWKPYMVYVPLDNNIHIEELGGSPSLSS